MKWLRELDRGWARFEGWLTVGVLLFMVLVAGFQALVRNLTRFDIDWANTMLTDMEWADSVLRKGTMWLAFLGASFATYSKKHIGIDVVLRLVPVRAKYTMLACSGVLAGLITFGLVYCFSAAVGLNLSERPLEYELLGDNGQIHVCDASQAQIDALHGFDMPTLFCGFRAVLDTIGIRSETPGAAFQLIVPIMLFVMALRLIGGGFAALRILGGGPSALAAAEAEVRRKEQSEGTAEAPQAQELGTP